MPSLKQNQGATVLFLFFTEIFFVLSSNRYGFQGCIRGLR